MSKEPFLGIARSAPFFSRVARSALFCVCSKLGCGGRVQVGASLALLDSVFEASWDAVEEFKWARRSIRSVLCLKRDLKQAGMRWKSSSGRAARSARFFSSRDSTRFARFFLFRVCFARCFSSCVSPRFSRFCSSRVEHGSTGMGTSWKGAAFWHLMF